MSGQSSLQSDVSLQAHWHQPSIAEGPFHPQLWNAEAVQVGAVRVETQHASQVASWVPRTLSLLAVRTLARVVDPAGPSRLRLRIHVTIARLQGAGLDDDS